MHTYECKNVLLVSNFLLALVFRCVMVSEMVLRVCVTPPLLLEI